MLSVAMIEETFRQSRVAAHEVIAIFMWATRHHDTACPLPAIQWAPC
jgi:hypothetical protein